MAESFSPHVDRKEQQQELKTVEEAVASIPRFKPKLIYDEYLPEEHIVSVPLADDDSDNETEKGKTVVVRESKKHKRIDSQGNTASTSASDSDSDSDSGTFPHFSPFPSFSRSG
jgi:hypothetical protein